MSKLKTAEEWITDDGIFPSNTKLVVNASRIRQIQANALRWASGVVNEMRFEGDCDLRCIAAGIRFKAEQLETEKVEG